MKFRKGRIYLVKFYDHNEATESTNPEGTLYIVGKYLQTKGKYLTFCNWWSGDGDMDDSAMTRANVLKKALIEARELR